VLVPTHTTPDGAIVRGHDFGREDGRGRDLDAIMDRMLTTGFQATALGQAVQELNRMVRERRRSEEDGARALFRPRRSRRAPAKRPPPEKSNEKTPPAPPPT
jgi:hypothetical protein